MRNTWLRFAVASAALGLALAATLGAAPVRTGSGLVTGAVADGVASWKGIPYAAPPVGDLRWRAPRPAPPWTGVKQATAYAHDCMQLPFPSDAAPLGTPPAEDCLYLNVWAPEKPASAKLPVMVWIYGGGFVNGGSSPAVYDGSHFARRGDRVRELQLPPRPLRLLRAPGAHQGERRRAARQLRLPRPDRGAPVGAGEHRGASAATRSNVTLFGESAGGGSVNTLMASPLAKGLFQKAICESGGGRANGPMAAPKLREPGPAGQPSAEAAGLALAKLVGVEGDDAAALAALRKLPAADLVRGLNLMTMGAQRDSYSGPMIDGKIVPEPVEDAFRAGRQARIPYMIGANNREFGFMTPPPAAVDGMLARFGVDKERVIAAYDPAGTGDKGEVGVGLASDGAMVEPARLLARLTAQAGQPTYVYRFSYVASSLRASTKGALHATEIPFVFETVRAKYGEATTAEDEALAAQANAYWAGFARSGDPNAEGLPKWPAYTAAGDVVMDLGIGGAAAKPDPWKARLDFVERAASSTAPLGWRGSARSRGRSPSSRAGRRGSARRSGASSPDAVPSWSWPTATSPMQKRRPRGSPRAARSPRRVGSTCATRRPSRAWWRTSASATAGSTTCSTTPGSPWAASSPLCGSRTGAMRSRST